MEPFRDLAKVLEQSVGSTYQVNVQFIYDLGGQVFADGNKMGETSVDVGWNYKKNKLTECGFSGKLDPITKEQEEKPYTMKKEDLDTRINDLLVKNIKDCNLDKAS